MNQNPPSDQDEIIREVRKIREELAARHNYDVRALYELAKKGQRKSNRQVVSLEPRTAKPVTRTA